MCNYRCGKNPSPGCPADNVEPATLASFEDSDDEDTGELALSGPDGVEPAFAFMGVPVREAEPGELPSHGVGSGGYILTVDGTATAPGPSYTVSTWTLGSDGKWHHEDGE